MPSDIVEEARALLTKTAPQGKITNGADAYLFDMQGPRLLRALADEVERLRVIAEDALRFRVEMNGSCNHDNYMIKLCSQCDIRAALRIGPP